MIVISIICSACGEIGVSNEGWLVPYSVETVHRDDLEKQGWLCGVKGRGKPERYETGKEDYCPRCKEKGEKP